MTHSNLKRNGVLFIPEILTLFLTLGFALPSPAFGLRPTEVSQRKAGLEELESALMGPSINHLTSLPTPAGLEEGQEGENLVSKTIRMGYSMHSLPSDLFVEQMESFYRRTRLPRGEKGTLKIILRGPNGMEREPRTRADLLAFGLGPKNNITIIAQGDVSPAVLEIAVGAVEYLFKEVAKAEQDVHGGGTHFSRAELSHRFGRRLSRLENALKEDRRNTGLEDVSLVDWKFERLVQGRPDVEGELVGRPVTFQRSTNSSHRPLWGLRHFVFGQTSHPSGGYRDFPSADSLWPVPGLLSG